MKVAILDDDLEQLDEILSIVEANGARAQGFSRAGALISMLRRETFDILILDWNLPDRSGLDVVRWARTHLNPSPPILLATSRATEADLVEGLNAGADDYLVKPLSPSVLNARINAVMRRVSAPGPTLSSETFGAFRFEPLARHAYVGANRIELTDKEFDLAILLFRNQHRALSRTYLLEAVWGGEPNLNSRTLDVHISRVRSKLDLKPEKGVRLAPVYGYGYRLETRIEPVQEGAP